MIFDSIRHVKEQPFIARAFEHIFPLLESAGLVDTAPGRKEVQGDSVFAVVHHYNTRPRSEGLWEAHRLYYDVQVVLRGEEKIGVCPIERMKSHTPYDPEKDAEFFTGDGEFITLREGMCMILGPQDIHMPGIMTSAPSAVRKLVIKYSVEAAHR